MNSNSKPIIGIVMMSGFAGGERKKKIQFVNQDYLDAISQAGGNPVVITLESQMSVALLDTLDGLLLVGGEDIAEECYHQKERSNNPRDNIEIELYEYFRESNKPVLGICRGMQLINVAEGGTLKDVEESSVIHGLGIDGWVYYHEIMIKPKTKVMKLINEDVYSVSSVHHQQIDEIGENIIVSAVSKDNVVEAIEVRDRNYIIGFQGHIEKCTDNYTRYMDVFREFIKEAGHGKKQN